MHRSSQEAQRKASRLARKKLPWLDGPQQSKPGHLPGRFSDSNENLTIGDASVSPSRGKHQDITVSQPSVSPISKPISELELRPTGSLPLLNEASKSSKVRSLSLGPRPDPLQSTKSSDEIKKAGVTSKKSVQTPAYSASEYSTASSAKSNRDISPTAVVKTVSPSEKPTKIRASRQSDIKEALYLKDPWRKSSADLGFDSEVFPRPPVRSIRRTSGCRSYDEPTYRDELHQLRKLKKARTMPRHPVTRPNTSTQPIAAESARRSTLFAMPTHLLGSNSSSSVSPRGLAASSPREIREQASPWRLSDAAVQGRQTYSLTRAVSGLEALMSEAINVAREAAHSGRNDEVANILDDASVALRKSSTVHKQISTGRSSQPLVLSPIQSAHYSEGDESVSTGSDLSTLHSRGSSCDTVPTVLTKSANSSRQPILVEQNRAGPHMSLPQKAAVRNSREIDPFSEDSIATTPPSLYQPPSADSIIRDFAYERKKKSMRSSTFPIGWGAAAEFYDDAGESVETQPGVRPSINPPMIRGDFRHGGHKQSRTEFDHRRRSSTVHALSKSRSEEIPLRHLANASRPSIPPRQSSRIHQKEYGAARSRLHRRRHKGSRHPHISRVLESPYYRPPEPPRSAAIARDLSRAASKLSDEQYTQDPEVEKHESIPADPSRYSGFPTDLRKDISLRHPRRKHISLREGQGFSLGRFHRRQPIAREWSNARKRMTAAIACMNTVFIGLIAGIYAGEVPRMQYQLADTTHKVILGNVLLFACLGITTLIFWPLPLLHGRKPYTLLSFAITLPLLFPQALSVTGYHSPNEVIYRCGLLIPRAFEGLALGFANINFLPTLFDLFGASLMSEKPHQEIVVYDNVRRQGGGVGVWLGIWSFCFVGSMSIGFSIGAVIISTLDPSWGFYIIVILLAFFLLINVVAPETRRSPYRRSISQFLDHEDNLKRRVARGEVKLHISNEGPKFWFQEVWAGLILTKRMASQTGFSILMLYLGWMYAQVTLVILLLGALLSRDYQWQPQYVSAASLAMAIGAFLAVPLSSANMFSRVRNKPPRTDSMTMRDTRITWTSHMVRRCLFTLTLPFAALAYTLSSPGPSVSWVTPTVFCGLVGFLSNLAIAECVGLIMETFDTCDLQPGVNSKHRLQSLAETTRRRRTNYSSFPRICAGFFAAQSLGFLLSAAATGVSGDVTRAVGAQTATAIVAAILLFLTVLFIGVLWRWKEVQVVPNNPFGVASEGGVVWGPAGEDPEWKAVIIGNPSGKTRRMNLLELGTLSRWTEIRKLNKLVPG